MQIDFQHNNMQSWTQLFLTVSVTLGAHATANFNLHSVLFKFKVTSTRLNKAGNAKHLAS